MGERQTHIREWLLDPTKSYEPLSSHRLVNTEVEFLCAFSSGETLLIQGPRLCRWAQDVARARQISWRELVDPIALILNIVPSFTATDARSLLESLGDRIWEFDTNHSLNCEQLVVWLDDGGPWYGIADVDQALSWLAWWAETQDAQLRSLAALVGQRLAGTADDPSLGPLFLVTSRDDAFEQLEIVLRLNQDVSSNVTLQSPPVLDSSVSQELFERFKVRISKQPPADDFSLDDIPVQFRYRVADTIAVQAKAIGSISTRLYEKLKRVLGPKGVEKLTEFIPVPDPGSVPLKPADVLKWYERSYLPWRTHPTMDPERARAIQAEFERWLLDQHPNMRTHPDNMALLGWVRVDRLQQSDRGSGITLLVIADGLGIDDIDRMKRTISQADKLMISRSEHVFTQIPTVTELTKPIIVNGDLSSASVEENGDKITRLDEVIRRLRVAKSGEFLAWTHAQPDRAYHFTSGKHEVANQVGAQLDVISKGIVDLFEQLPHLELRVILTTDHGRFHGKGTRRLVAPPGLNPHGRAAWGETSQSLDEIHETRDGMVWLNPHSYGLPAGSSYVVALGDSMFATSDSRGGSEWYPHGGLSPEEVIVAWVEICRQSDIGDLLVEMSGSGTAHKAGTFVMNIVNPNDVPVKMVSCTVSSDSGEGVSDAPESAPSFAPIDMSLNFVAIPELNSERISVEISSWPFTQPSENAVGRLVYQLPSGEERSVSVSASIATQSMYNPTLTLDDLEDL